MTWLRTRPLVVRERCPVPNPTGHKTGAIWQCGTCGRRWVLRYEPGSKTFKVWTPRVLPWPRGRRPIGGWGKHALVITDDDRAE